MNRHESVGEIFIWNCFHYCCDAHNDGFSQFEKKKNLYRMKWLLEDLIPKTPTFVGEDEFIAKKGDTE